MWLNRITYGRFRGEFLDSYARAREANPRRSWEFSDQYARGLNFSKVQFSERGERQPVRLPKFLSFPNVTVGFGFALAWQFLAHYARTHARAIFTENPAEETKGNCLTHARESWLKGENVWLET